MITDGEILTMSQSARRFAGAYTGTSGTLAGYVIRLLSEREGIMGWKKCSDSIPPTDTDVLVFLPGGRIVIASLRENAETGSIWWESDDDLLAGETVTFATYWMRLPDAPGEG